MSLQGSVCTLYCFCFFCAAGQGWLGYLQGKAGRGSLQGMPRPGTLSGSSTFALDDSRRAMHASRPSRSPSSLPLAAMCNGVCPSCIQYTHLSQNLTVLNTLMSRSGHATICLWSTCDFPDSSSCVQLQQPPARQWYLSAGVWSAACLLSPN